MTIAYFQNYGTNSLVRGE